MNKWKSRSLTSIHDEIILEYQVNLLRFEVRDTKLERGKLRNELADLSEQKYNIQIQVLAR